MADTKKVLWNAAHGIVALFVSVEFAVLLQACDFPKSTDAPSQFMCRLHRGKFYQPGTSVAVERELDFWHWEAEMKDRLLAGIPLLKGVQTNFGQSGNQTNNPGTNAGANK